MTLIKSLTRGYKKAVKSVKAEIADCIIETALV